MHTRAARPPDSDASISVMSRERQKFPRLRLFFSRSRNKKGEGEGLGPDGGTQSAGEGFRPAADILIAFGLDHNASERLGARITQHHTPGIAERGFGFAKDAGDFGKGIKGRL